MVPLKAKHRFSFSIYFYLAILAVLACILSVSHPESLPVVSSDVSQWQGVLDDFFQTRNHTLLTGNADQLKTMYVSNEKNGRWAVELELNRSKYLKDWSARQGIQFKSIDSIVNIKRVRKIGRGYAFYVVVSTSYTYVYEDQPEQGNFFRIGTYHSLDVIPGKEEGIWLISREWYLDPFQDSLNQKNFNSNEIKRFVLSQPERDFSDIVSRRKKAVEYADRYAGAASDGENGYDYNNKYPNYNHRGGDCSNYISQTLHESGFKTGGGWSYDKSSATHAWCNASGLKNYLLYSGKANIIAKGTYSQVYKTAYKLIPGDIIAYQEKGDVVHTAIVTATDSKGYPLVNTHTTDRFHVPWDLGWNDNDIKFFLLKVNYPS